MPSKVSGSYDPNQAYWRNAAEKSNDEHELMKQQMKKVHGNFEHRPGKYKKPTFWLWVVFVVLVIGSITAGILLFGQTPEDTGYVLTYETYDGSILDSQTYFLRDKIILPEDPIKEGYIFAGWYLDEAYEQPLEAFQLNAYVFTSDMTFYAKWINQSAMISLSFNTDGGVPLNQVMVPFGTSLSPYVTTKENEYFGGWSLSTVNQSITFTPDHNATLYALWDPMPMKPIGETQTFYEVPVIQDDEETLSYVSGGFWMSETEVTYELWYEVYQWAIDHGYQFNNQGRDGMVGFLGTTPRAGDPYPVNTINYYDVLIWLNALSNKEGLDPVYLDFNSNLPIVSMGDINATYMSNRNGYRLPTDEEWHMAAKLTNESMANDQLIQTRDHYWTKGNVYSGMTSSLHDAIDYAWLSINSDGKMYSVGLKLPNTSGIYDMSGNVCEYVYGLHRLGVKCNGGSFLNDHTLDHQRYVSPRTTALDQGFRVVRG